MGKERETYSIYVDDQVFRITLDEGQTAKALARDLGNNVRVTLTVDRKPKRKRKAKR